MTLFLAAMGALGVVVFVQSFPVLRRPRLAHRVEPYLVGLRGAPSRLLSSEAGALELFSRSKVGRVILRFLPGAPDDLGERLRSAGLSMSPIAFRLAQFSWALVTLLIFWLAAVVAIQAGWGPGPTAFLVLSAFALVGGFAARDWWLGKEIEARRNLLQQELPTAIDLLTLALIAGEPVTGAFERVGRQIHGAIGQELEAVVSDVRAGAPLIDSLEDLKSRVPAGGIGRFVDALVAGIERGSPLADVLSAQADDGREARRRMLMELGGKREILMLLPVVFLIMPIVVIFALLPGLVSLDLLVP